MVNSFCKVTAIYSESFYCLSHCITLLESLLSFMLRDSPWPWEPSHPSQAQNVSGGDMQTLGRTVPVGLSQGSGVRQGPQLTPRAHRHCSRVPQAALKRKVAQGARGAAPTQTGTSQNQKGKRMEPPTPAVSLITLKNPHSLGTIPDLCLQ